MTPPRPLAPQEVADRVRLLRQRRAGLGDMVAEGLAALGVTKEAVSKMLGRPCQCEQRRQALNRLGQRFGIG
jgi:hypothetical protein